MQALRVHRRSHRTERHARLLIIRMARIYRALFKGARSASPPEPLFTRTLAVPSYTCSRDCQSAPLRPPPNVRSHQSRGQRGGGGGERRLGQGHDGRDPARLPERTAGRAPSSRTATFHPESSSIQHPPPLVPLLWAQSNTNRKQTLRFLQPRLKRRRRQKQCIPGGSFSFQNRMG